MANSEYMFLLLSIIVYYMTKIYIFSFLSDITLPVWKQLTILALALFFNQFPYLSPLLIDPLLFLVVLRQETKQLFSLKALFLAVAPSVLVDLLSRFMGTIVIPYLFLSSGIYLGHIIFDLLRFKIFMPKRFMKLTTTGMINTIISRSLGKLISHRLRAYCQLKLSVRKNQVLI